MLFDFAFVFIYLVLALVFVLAALVASKLVQPVNPYPEKSMTYECGEKPLGPGWTRFNFRFFLIAIVFLIFDVEVAFLVPVAVIFKEATASTSTAILVFTEIMIFVTILAFGLAYVWAKGDFVWIKSLKESNKEEKA